MWVNYHRFWRWQSEPRDGEGGYVLDQEEAISDLLREHGLTEANSTFAPIGTDCYELRQIDSALLEATSTNEKPTTKEFQ